LLSAFQLRPRSAAPPGRAIRAFMKTSDGG
jgi:hypothetical protein